MSEGRFGDKKFFSSRSIALIVFVPCFAISAVLTRQQINLQNEERKSEIERISASIEREMHETLRAGNTALISLALTVDANGTPTNFDSIAAQLIQSNPYLDILELVPKGVIEYVYPLKGNEQVLGYDIMADPKRKKEAQKAIEERRVYFAGPLQLKQGGMAVIGRLPVFRKDSFWGFSAVIMHLETLLEASGITELDQDEFYVQLYKENPITGTEEHFLKAQEIESTVEGKSIVFPDGNWKLFIKYKPGKYERLIVVSQIFLGLVISLGIALLVMYMLKKPREELKSLSRQLSVHLESSPLGVVEYNKDLQITGWSKRCEEIFGWSKAEVLSKKMTGYDLVHKDDLEKAQEVGNELSTGTVKGQISKNRNYTRSGAVVHCLWYNSNFKDDNGNVVSAMSLVQDVSEQEFFEAERIKSEAELNLIFNSTNDIMFLLEVGRNEQFAYRSVNKPFLDTANLKQYEVLDELAHSLLHLEGTNRLHSLLVQVLETGQSISYEEPIEFQGKNMFLETTLSPIYDEEGDCVNILGVSRNITARKESEMELSQSFGLVAEQNERLLNFAYIVSHNLRTHSSNISGILSMLKDTTEPKEQARLHAYLQVVSDALNETMLHLNEVVTIQTNINQALSTLNLNQYLDKTIDLLRERIAQKEAVVENQIPENIQIQFNTSYLESVLLNFISNALKYASADRVPHIIAAVSETESWVELRISDNGIGIDMDKYGKSIFGMYKRFNLDTEGKGLGLFITKNQIEAMGGRVEVESTLGVGTTFTIYFKKESTTVQSSIVENVL